MLFPNVQRMELTYFSCVIRSEGDTVDKEITSCAGGRHNLLRPYKLTFDLLTLKVVSESRVTRATSVPILVFLGLSVLDLDPRYATDRCQTDVRRASSLNAPAMGAGHNNGCYLSYLGYKTQRKTQEKRNLRRRRMDWTLNINVVAGRTRDRSHWRDRTHDATNHSSRMAHDVYSQKHE